MKIKNILDRVGENIGSKKGVDIAKELGVKPAAVANWKKREAIPYELLIDFAGKRKISLDWLLRGERLDVEPSLNIQVTRQLKTFHADFAYDKYVPVRLLRDEIAAGAPMEVMESDVEGYCVIYADKEWMPLAPDQYTCCRVQGSSMQEILYSGDIVAIEHYKHDIQSLHGEMVAFRENGGVTIKWLVLKEGGEVLGIPENRDQLNTALYFSAKEAESAIVGRVAWWWAKRRMKKR
jgi:phage repressor protein C with HTH and peptisase S24 domain